MQLSEEIQYDEKVEKYFQGGMMQVEKDQDWDYVVVSYFLKGNLQHQEQLLSEEISAEMEAADQDQGLQEVENITQELPVSQAFSDVGPSNDNTKLGKPFDEKSDTGDDLTRTGPEGNAPADNYNGTNYDGQSTTKLNAATGIELEPYPKQIYDVSGTPPELQEDIRIEITDPAGDEKFMPPITIEIEGHIESNEKTKDDSLQDHDLMNHEGRKDPGTHTNTIKAGERGIDDLMPISDIWKSPNDGMVQETKQFSFIGDKTFDEAIYGSGQDQEQFNQPSTWIGTVTWNPTTLDATVVMNGKSYNHANVQGKDFDSFAGAPSKGAHWNRFWKDQFNSTNYSESLNITQKEQYEFDWIDESAIHEMKKYAADHGNGRFLLAVVSGETTTDHRIEGRDKHQRKWTREELIQNIRTGKGKMTDINHLWTKIDPESGGVYDANWNFKTDRGEMILWETDQQILEAIDNDIITAVSINTGAPRHIHENCDVGGECFIEPHGTILGEANGIALAFVVTHPKGFNYNGEIIPAFPPGMKLTKIYSVL